MTPATANRARRESTCPRLPSLTAAGATCDGADSASGLLPVWLWTSRQYSVGESAVVLSLGAVGFCVDIAILLSPDRFAVRLDVLFHPLHMRERRRATLR